MWEYTGPKDVTWTKADELSRDEFDTRIRVITNIVGEETPVLAAKPFARDNPPTVVTAQALIFLLVASFSFELNFLTFLCSFLHNKDHGVYYPPLSDGKLTRVDSVADSELTEKEEEVAA